MKRLNTYSLILISLCVLTIFSCKKKTPTSNDIDTGHYEFTLPFTIPAINDTEWHQMDSLNIKAKVDSFKVENQALIKQISKIQVKWSNFYLANLNLSFNGISDSKIEVSSTGLPTLIIAANFNMPNNL